MNIKNLHQIFDRYIECFDQINGTEHKEYYKWQIAFRFKPAMDDALISPDDIFDEKLHACRKLTVNLIDSYTTPFHGLCKFAEFEPATVKSMFSSLIYDHSFSPKDRIARFISQSDQRQQKYFPDSFLYSNDFHSVSGFLFLYDPEQYYMFKSKNSGRFADCIGFMENWGSEKDVDYDVFCRMCDQVIQEINNYPKLLKVDQKRFDGRFANSKYGNVLHPDNNKHILLFDLIYCCTVYDFFAGMHFEKRQFSKEAKEDRLKQSKAISFSNQQRKYQEKMDRYADIIEEILRVLHNGEELNHKTYGKGVVTSVDRQYIRVDFDEAGEKKFVLLTAFAKGFLSSKNETLRKILQENEELLSEYENVKHKYDDLNKKLRDFIAYLPNK